MHKPQRKIAPLPLGILLFLLALPLAARALPVAVEQVEGAHSLRHAAFYLVDKRGAVGILEASSPVRQNQYMRLEDGIPLASEGVLWLRFSLIKNNQALMRPLPEGARPPLHLDLGKGMRGARLYVAESVSTDGEIKAWRESMPLNNGRFELPEPQLLPLTVYVRLPGIPSLWFDPLLMRGQEDSGPFTWTLILQISLGLALAIMLVRGITENEEWRFWASAVLACAMIPALFGQYGSESRIIYLTAMPRLLAPGLAIMLIPHLGRYLMNSRGRKALDYTLIILSMPGVAVALAPLIPGLGWTARLLPLAPLLLLPLVLIAAARAKGGQSGALLYFFFCLFPFAGALLALLPLISPAFPALDLIGPGLTTLGYLAGGLLLAVGKPSVSKEKGDFFPLNDLFEESVLPGGQRHKGEAPSKAAREEVCFPDELLDGPPLNLGRAPVAGLDCDPEPPAEAAPAASPEAATKALAETPAEVFAEAPEETPEAEEAAPPEPEVIDLGPDLEVFAEAESPEAPPEQTEAETIGPETAESGEENIIYLRDEEEPGLVLLKPAGNEPIEGVAPVHAAPAHNWEYTAISRLESALRAPYEQLVSQLAELQSRQELADGQAEGLGKSLSGLGLMLDNLERLARGEPLAPGPGQTIFNLAQLIRRIHEELLPKAEERGITLSWFVSPGLPAYFKGQEREIAQAVKFLLQGTLDGAADGLAGGAVQLAVRRGSGNYAGQIQFTLQESGLGGHPQRPSGWLNKAWELAAASGGSFNIDSIPGKGMAITLALPLIPVSEPPRPELAEQDAALGPAPEDDEEIILLTDAISPEKAAPQSAPPDSPQDAAPVLEPVENLIILSDDEIMDVPREPVPGPSPEVSAPRPAPSSKKSAPAREPAPADGPREYVVIADMAASGRRLIARRLEGLPHKLAEAKNADEIARAVQRHPVGLVIIDADMPEPDMKNALEKIADYNLRHALPPTPSLCLLAHESQAERLLRLGCTETQIKTASRVQFRQAVLRLAPHPKADPAELLPESPLLRAAMQDPQPEAKPEAPSLSKPQPDPQPELKTVPQAPARPVKKNAAKKGARVPMLDLIVASLDEEGDESAENNVKSPPARIAPDLNTLREAYPLSGSDGEYMEAEMVPLIPGLLIVLEESLNDLASSKAKGDAEHVRDVAARMAGQGSTFGLFTLERMARYVERAAEAEDDEAVRDFTAELLSIGRRHLAALKETHEDYLKKQ